MMFDLCQSATLRGLLFLKRPWTMLLVVKLLVVNLSGIALCSSLCSTLGAQTPIRHQIYADRVQAFLNGGNQAFTDFSSEIGLRYYGAATAPDETDPCGCADLGSDDFVLNIANSAAWSIADPDLTPGFQHDLKNELRFLFRGTGLDLLYAATPVGADLRWEIVDGGTEGNFNSIASGSFSTLNAASTLNTAQLAVPGSLETDRLHMLRVWPEEGGIGPAGPQWISLDAFDVYGNQEFTIDDSLNVRSPANLDGSWIPGPTWGNELDKSEIPSIGGGVSRSTTDGATMTVKFNGSSLAIFGSQIAGETATYDWQINGGGPGLEGTIDQTLDSNFAYRWPQVLVNGLSYAENTLVVTVNNNGGAGTAGALGPKPQLDGGSTELDAISIISFADLGVRADFDLDRDVDGADFLQWQRGFGNQPDAMRGDGDANRDGLVDNLDFLIWQLELGNSVASATATATASALGVPEPSAAALASIAVLFLQYVRRRR